MTVTLSRSQVLGFRVARHRLSERVPAGSLPAAAAVLGIRSAAGRLAFAARVDGVVRAADVADALTSKTLVHVMSARANPTFVPVGDVATFTIGCLPIGDGAITLLAAFDATLERVGIAAGAALGRAVAVATEALADGPLSRGDLSGVLTDALPDLSPMCRGRCTVAHIDEMLFRLVGVAGIWCLTADGQARPVDREEPNHVRLDQWLGAFPDRAVDAATDARRKLLRCYLRAFAASTPAAFGLWAGFSTTEVKSRLDELADEIEPVRIEGSKQQRVALRSDIDELLATLASGPSPFARFLPLYDPYLLGQDRALTLPDRAQQQQLWRGTSGPGAVLVDGEIVGTFRTSTRRSHVRMRISPFGLLPPSTWDLLEAEAAVFLEPDRVDSLEVASED